MSRPHPSGKLMQQEPVANPDAVRFSSSAVPDCALMEFLHDYYGVAGARMQLDLTGNCPPTVELEACLLEGAVLGRGAIGGLALTRTAELISTDGIDSVLLLASDAVFQGRLRGDAETVRRGEVFVTSYGAASAQVAWQETSRIRSLQLDSGRLSALLPGFDPERIHILEGEHRAGLLFRYADILRGIDLGDANLRSTATTHLFDLAALALGATGDYAEQAREQGVRAARLALIQEQLRRQFDDPELSVIAIAHRHGISVRYLQTLFEHEGTTYSSFLTAIRMEFAATRLRDPRFRNMRIADIAFDAGYSDLTAFNRAFRKFHGETPSQMRTG